MQRGQSIRASSARISRSLPSRRTVPEAIALGMVDRRLEVLKVETDQGTEFVLRDDFDALQEESHDCFARSSYSGRFAGQFFRSRRARARLRETAGQRSRARWPAAWRCRRKP